MPCVELGKTSPAAQTKCPSNFKGTPSKCKAASTQVSTVPDLAEFEQGQLTLTYPTTPMPPPRSSHELKPVNENRMSCPVKPHDRGVSAPYFFCAQVLVEVIVVQAWRLVTLVGAPSLLQELTVCRTQKMQATSIVRLAGARGNTKGVRCHSFTTTSFDCNKATSCQLETYQLHHAKMSACWKSRVSVTPGQ